MIRFLIRAGIWLVSAFLGLVIADLLLPGFSLHWNNWWGVVLAVVIFAVLQSVLAPWIMKVATRRAPAFVGGIGLVSTFIALLIAVIIPAAGIGIDGPVAWIVGTLVVWLVTALATWLLPGIFLKDTIQQKKS
ncbi:phage holin family protein [Microbacterium candidum]|uniref:Phage holin family protein n=1 Tax=Microbacterium candidum TaxID=3041922 RepID=A0ABT7N1C9_9MICO|nr:phage holin family protein [Microbacterium sp. ASV49]MDL9980475.1 phage holin family protein [Microbacterium sp. ASV49]